MIKKILVFSLITASLYSCKKTANTETTVDPVSAEVKAKITNLGFSSANVQKTDDGYLVEGDIELTDELLNSTPAQTLLRIAGDEQYRTTNLVTGLPRVIKVKVTGLGTAFISGTDLAISRYNALGLKITFQRITSGTANITIQGFNQGPSGGFITLGSSGFPTNNGNPYGTIKMNTNAQAYGSNPDVNYVGSVIQHEIGHCIGMRHTDYYNRAYSCGGSAVNEGASNIGAILIPGTPSTANAGSWMLACSNGGDRTFNSNDIIGLNYLYK
ncbi:M57 family metalloprotease [Ferruginibacter sp. SUN106]|uniref:M57 family metalloprotease n=1 Tax=Ferruginibacter sp. SUN106 TaxID=2978348 RepID=UPI003D363561